MEFITFTGRNTAGIIVEYTIPLRILILSKESTTHRARFSSGGSLFVVDLTEEEYKRIKKIIYPQRSNTGPK